ncbi:OprD family porin [Pseudomonas sp. Q1-7]|uniref:OprD family porin n=1 Tax=Pseudomonas sp. Q1-7 TaxID=3020843 RepID=UPI002300FC1A|nr:OprD family porin [Pseudomonas sp. Q1-7]
MRKLGWVACGLSVLPFSVTAEGFIEDSKMTLLSRTYYFNRDYRDQASKAGRNRFKPESERNGYREELTQGLQARFTSGYTAGTVGLGVDAHAMLGLKLDSGGGRTGTGNLPVGADGHPDDSYGKLGGALKLRHGATQLKYGQMNTTAPVFAASSSRTLPGMAYGLHAESRAIDHWLLEAGHFNAASGPGESKVHGEISTVYGRGRVDSVDYLGTVWQASDDLALSLYSSRFEDIWRQHYLGADYRLPLEEMQALRLKLDLYRSRSTGQERFGAIDNLASSLALSYERGPQRLTLAYQRVSGDQPFDYLAFGDGRSSASINLANSLGYSDFNGPGERSWQLRHDLDLSALGWAGWRTYALHARGRHSDGSQTAPDSRYAGKYGRGGRHFEADVGLAWQLQAGPLAGLSLRASQVWHRSNTAYPDDDIDETRLILDYPLDLR